MRVTHSTMSPPWEVIGTGVAAVLAGVGELYRRGKLRFRREPKANGNGPGMNHDEHATLNDIATTTERIEQKTDRNAYLIQEFHGEEDISVPVNDVLDDDDFYRGGGDGP